VTGIELCKAHAALKQPVEAREICLGVARIPPLPQETSRSRDARFEAGTIAEEQRSKIGALRVVVKGVPAGREPTVTVDGVALPPAALTEPRAVNPGVHVITARVGQGAETEATLETREGESRDLELVVQPPPAGEVPAAPSAALAEKAGKPEKPEKKTSTLAIVSFGVAGVAAAVGTVTGVIALNAENSLATLCPDKACGRDEHERLRDARAAGTASTVMFVVAGVALGAGIVTLLTHGSSKSAAAPVPRTKTASTKPTITPTFGLGGVGIHGSF
jgi:hypothetical protein